MTVDLRHVAQASGVSVSTASRALAGSSRVNAETARRIRTAAQQLGYRPNAAARALRTSRTRLVGLVVTNLLNASLRTIAEVVQQAMASQGLQLMLSVTGGDLEAERAALHTLVDHQATGVIVVGLDSRATDELGRAGLPVVHLARRPERPVGDCVLGDDLAGARAAAAYLLDLDHRRIAVITGPQDVTSGRERLLGFRTEMQEHGRPVDPNLIVTGGFTPATGSAAVRTLWDRPADERPTGLLVTNSEAILGVLPALRERRIRVPGQLSVICFEDSELTRWWHPAITVVDNNAAEMGRLAARLLLDRIDGRRPRAGTADIADFRVGTTLVLRESCARPVDVRDRVGTRR